MTSKSIKDKVYNRAPLLDVVMDVNVQFAESVNIAKLDALHDQIEGYATKEEISIARTEINFNQASARANHSNEQLGIRLISDDKKYVVQFKKTGFTFSQVNDYEGWENFQTKAKTLWTKYFDNLKPTKITRVGLRYVNKIDIPDTNFNLEDYFETYPRVLSGNKAILSGFFLQVQIPQSEGGLAILNQTVTTPPNPGYTSVLFDIDVFDLKHLDPNDKKVFWDRIELLRKQKNVLFEESITEKTKELFS